MSSSQTAGVAVNGAAAAPVGAQELLLRLVGAALQLFSTWAVVHSLSVEATGTYFRGVVIAVGMAALLRGKYEIYLAYHIISRRSAAGGVSDGCLLMQLGRRVLLRAAVICGLLLVITADVDIQAPRFQPVLETYLPFVLAIPFVSLSTLIGEALRAGNRALGGTVLTSYALNASMLLAVALTPRGASPALYSWLFLAASALSALLALALARRAFPARLAEGSKPLCREMFAAADVREWMGLSRALLLWGPLCILAAWASALQMAQYAVASRTALIMDFLLPALNLSGGPEMAGAADASLMRGRSLMTQLRRSLLYSAAFSAALIFVAPATFALYGSPYDAQWTLYILLLAAQWANSVGRPAIRYLVARWDSHLVARTLGAAALATVLLCAVGFPRFGVLAAAAATLIGALAVNARAIVASLGRAQT